MDIFTLFHYTYVQHALIAGVAVAVACGVMGVFLVLRNMSLVGDGLSHVGFAGIALGIFLGVVPIIAILPTMVLGSLMIVYIRQRTQVYADAAIGMISSLGIATGILISSRVGGLNLDIMNFLFGSILTVSNGEMTLAILLCLVVIAVVHRYYWGLVTATFDQEYAQTRGIRTGSIDVILTVLTGLTVAIAIKVVGVVLVSSTLIFPAVGALQMARSMRSVIGVSASLGVLSMTLGIVISFVSDLPTGATIVLIQSVMLTVILLYRSLSRPVHT